MSIKPHDFAQFTGSSVIGGESPEAFSTAQVAMSTMNITPASMHASNSVPNHGGMGHGR